jgi:hypothetical protein
MINIHPTVDGDIEDWYFYGTERVIYGGDDGTVGLPSSDRAMTPE